MGLESSDPTVKDGLGADGPFGTEWGGGTNGTFSSDVCFGIDGWLDPVSTPNALTRCRPDPEGGVGPVEDIGLCRGLDARPPWEQCSASTCTFLYVLCASIVLTTLCVDLMRGQC